MNDNQAKKVKSYRLSEDVVDRLDILREYHRAEQRRKGLRNNFSVANVIELMVNQEFDRIKLEAPEWVRKAEIRVKGDRDND